MIGILDSGIGGLTVARALSDRLPDYNMVFFGDTARGPYGSKSAEIVTDCTLRGIDFLLNRGSEIIVIACNTASCLAGERVTERFDIPIFEAVTPAAELSVEISEKSGIGVIGTRAVIDSGAYEKKIRELDPRARVCSAACPLLVPLVEEGWLRKPETRMIVKKYLHPLKVRQIDTLIMGCTHYPILKKIIQRKIGKRVSLIDSSTTVAEKVRQFLEQHPETDDLLGKEGETEFFVSDLTEHLKKAAKVTFGRNVLLKRIEH
ncbi:glutamate racemase [Desulfobacterales bacterium HSG2]|nr:glutamate racemase [Desulfobacterales bacterium HSG2]